MHEFQTKIPTPDEVFTLADSLKQGDDNVCVYMVGGCVRDHLYGLFHRPGQEPSPPKDIDLTTNLTEEEILSRLRSNSARKNGISVHEKESVDTFGVVFANINGKDFEIAPFRKDSGTKDGRRPEFVEIGTIEDDAMRRDLTINNLYYDFEKEVVLDFNPDAQGIEDIKNRVARFVGDPHTRIDEDKLRVLRFVRFHSRLSDLSIRQSMDCHTASAIDNFKNLLDHKRISHERIQSEFLAGIKQSISTSSYLLNLYFLGLMDCIFPNMTLNVFTIPFLKNIKNENVIIACLLGDNSNLKKRLNDLKYPNEISEAVQFLVNVQNINTDDCVHVLKGRYRGVISPKDRSLTNE